MTETTKAASIVTELVRAFKAMAIYPPGHPSRARFFQKLLTDISECLAVEPIIEFKIEASAITLSGEPLEAKDGSCQYLARECFLRQISSLRFMRGLIAEDLEIFLDLLAMDVEVIRNAGGAVEILRGKGSGSFQLEQVDYEGILVRRVEVVDQDQSQYGSETISPVAPPEGVTDLSTATPRLTDADRPEITQDEWLAAKLLELDKADNVAQYKAVLNDIMSSLRATGGMGMPHYAAAVLKHLGKYLLKPVHDEISRVNMEAIQSLAQPPVIAEVVAQLTMREQPDREAIEAVLLQTHSMSIQELLRRLAEENESFGRRTIISFLGRFGGALRPHLERWLRDDRWYVVRNALGLLQQVGGQHDSANVRTFLQHPHPKIRLEALRFLYRFPIKVDEGLMNRLLDDADLEVQARAVYALGVLLGAKGLQRLITLAKKPLFGEGDLIRREMAIKGLGREGGDRAIQFLSDVLRTRSFFSPEAGERIQNAAVDALVEIGGPRTVNAFRRSLPRLKGQALRDAQDFLRRDGENSIEN